ncbi:hypothetical protein SARC_10445 [Sphaeroforma arctica JP610]|uniref:Uncharacterized protein n=1 Tax=Sphaeroforma arctica JP610 TaxID=667725 RepID=A0A0L0FJZ1_9EUKA|nr:hypothetical protein SARC_10445 [Sphaeroforma arctica JP610]KNC77084.1 hypothetical protein SARC_10445 [Sphaeroforma arctica JP610]|eukprot:XP_014150986.1 hypothetical protein SARC_10445 [Sphaeroforma arctica JP610]
MSSAFDEATVHKKPVWGVAVMSPGLKKAEYQPSCTIYQLSKQVVNQKVQQIQCDLLCMGLDTLPRNGIDIFVYATDAASDCVGTAVTMKQRRPHINQNTMLKDVCSKVSEIRDWLNKVDIICKYVNGSHFVTTYLAKLTAKMYNGRSLDVPAGEFDSHFVYRVTRGFRIVMLKLCLREIIGLIEYSTVIVGTTTRIMDGVSTKTDKRNAEAEEWIGSDDFVHTGLAICRTV